MPELPEVETVVRDLRTHRLEGAVIRSVSLGWPRLVSGVNPSDFAAALCGRSIVRISRQGKNILLWLDNGSCLHVHLRMTGKFRIEPTGPASRPHDHLMFVLGDGRKLVFNDTRKFGRFRIVPKGVNGLSDLGPDALDDAFTAELFRHRLEGRRRMIKPLLLDQTVLAGLGNIYVDESLWDAGIHPCRTADTLGKAELRRLYHAIRSVLRRAVLNGGTTLGTGSANFYTVSGRRGMHAGKLKVFRRAGKSCPRCGTRIIRIVVGQRGTHVCPSCQTGVV
jgi:formamidopyrimidine-DNA glycosylase